MLFKILPLIGLSIAAQANPAQDKQLDYMIGQMKNESGGSGLVCTTFGLPDDNGHSDPSAPYESEICVNAPSGVLQGPVTFGWNRSLKTNGLHRIDYYAGGKKHGISARYDEKSGSLIGLQVHLKGKLVSKSLNAILGSTIACDTFSAETLKKPSQDANVSRAVLQSDDAETLAYELNWLRSLKSTEPYFAGQVGLWSDNGQRDPRYNGFTKTVGADSNGDLHGPQLVMSDDSKISYLKSYDHGVLHGPVIVVDHAAGTVLGLSIYRQGKFVCNK